MQRVALLPLRPVYRHLAAALENERGEGACRVLHLRVEHHHLLLEPRNVLAQLVDLGLGGMSCEVVGADLSYDYVKENADYRS